MDGSWSAAIDAYCERLDPSFWAEPFNALTNLAFLVAAGIAAAAARWRDPAVLVLGVLSATIGIGSFLFHTAATRWAALADVLPIAVFIVVCLVLILRRLLGLPWLTAVGLGIAFIPASALLGWLARPLVEPVLGSGGGYLAPLLALLACAVALIARRHPAGMPLLGTAGLFLVSLTFRTLDLPLCSTWPPGTHWLWHLLNGLVLGRLMLTLARHGPGAAPHSSKT